MINVMVTGVSGNVGQGIIAGIRNIDTSKNSSKYWILGTDISKDCAGYYMCDKGIQVPCARDVNFASTIKKIIKNNDIKYVLIGVDEEVVEYAKWKDKIETETGCKIIVSDYEFVKISTDKYLTHKYLQKIGLETPCTLIASDDELSIIYMSLPIVAKPRNGHGSIGLRIINSQRELLEFIKVSSNYYEYCFQEYLCGKEYTCGLLFDQDNNLVDSITMRRKLEGGTTVEACVDNENDEIQKIIDRFVVGIKNSGYKVFGSINLQLKGKIDNNNVKEKYYIHEINPRFSGTTSLRVKVGYNDVCRILDNLALGIKIEKANVKNNIRLFRYWETMVVGL